MPLAKAFCEPASDAQPIVRVVEELLQVPGPPCVEYEVRYIYRINN